MASNTTSNLMIWLIINIFLSILVSLVGGYTLDTGTYSINTEGNITDDFNAVKDISSYQAGIETLGLPWTLFWVLQTLNVVWIGAIIYAMIRGY